MQTDAKDEGDDAAVDVEIEKVRWDVKWDAASVTVDECKILSSESADLLLLLQKRWIEGN